MKKKTIIAIILGITIIGGIAILGSSLSKVKPIEVKVATVDKGDVSDMLSTTGVVKSETSKDYFGSQGKVKKIHVSVGDKVSKGDVLIEFDVDNFETTVAQAEIQYNNAVLSKEILVSNNKKLKEKISELNSEINKIDKRIAELESLNDASLSVSIAELKTQRKALVQSRDSISPISNEQLQQADNAVKLAKTSLDSAKKASSSVTSVLKAEFDGVVTNIYAVEGSMSTGAQPVCTVQDIEDLKITLGIGKYDSKLIKLGQPAQLYVEDEIISGEVSFISPTASALAMQGEAMLTADVTLDGFHESLKVDFTENIDILVNEAKDVTRVPMEAVKYLSDGTAVVYVVTNDMVKEVKVETGVESDIYIEIKKGVNFGDKVVLNPGEDIVNNTAVNVRKSEV